MPNWKTFCCFSIFMVFATEVASETTCKIEAATSAASRLKNTYETAIFGEINKIDDFYKKYDLDFRQSLSFDPIRACAGMHTALAINPSSNEEFLESYHNDADLLSLAILNKTTTVQILAHLATFGDNLAQLEKTYLIDKMREDSATRELNDLVRKYSILQCSLFSLTLDPNETSFLNKRYLDILPSLWQASQEIGGFDFSVLSGIYQISSGDAMAYESGVKLLERAKKEKDFLSGDISTILECSDQLSNFRFEK